MAVKDTGAKGKTHKIKPGVPIHLFMKMEPTDLQKFGDMQVTVLANRRSVEKKTPKKGKPPKKGPAKNN